MKLFSQLMAVGLILAVLSVDAGAVLGNLDSSDIIFHYHGADTASRLGTAISCVGDVNGDGFSDIAISSDSPEGTYVFFGGNPVDSFPDMFLKGSLGPAASIDLTGDGVNEVITVRRFEVNMIPCGVIYFYRGWPDSLESEPYDSLMPELPNYGFGALLRVGYVNEGPFGDIVTGAWATAGGVTLYYFADCPPVDKSPDWELWVPWAEYSCMAGAAVVDYGGDGVLDLMVGLCGRHASGRALVIAGPDFAAEADLTIGYPVELFVENPAKDTFRVPDDVYALGDIDGDGWDDVGLPWGSASLIYRVGPSADTVYDYRLDHSSGCMASAGDLNGDGHNDLVTEGADLSSFGNVNVYLGGPVFDTIVDDWLFRSDLPPLYLDYIGWQVSAAGDFNGDGYGDFVFSCQNFSGGEPGDVFVVAGGPHIVTDVEEPPSTVLPNSAGWIRGYPNPGNPGTTLEFSLSSKDCISIDVFNSLGQRVATVLEGQLSGPGRHEVIWGGLTSSGEQVSSGVYIFKLTGGKHEASAKVVLIK